MRVRPTSCRSISPTNIPRRARSSRVTRARAEPRARDVSIPGASWRCTSCTGSCTCAVTTITRNVIDVRCAQRNNACSRRSVGRWTRRRTTIECDEPLDRAVRTCIRERARGTCAHTRPPSRRDEPSSRKSATKSPAIRRGRTRAHACARSRAGDAHARSAHDRFGHAPDLRDGREDRSRRAPRRFSDARTGRARRHARDQARDLARNDARRSAALGQVVARLPRGSQALAG